MPLAPLRAVLLLALLALGLSPGLAAAEPGAPCPRERLTPRPGPQPRLTGPRSVGVRPGSPLIHRLTATGERPITFSATGLPAGVVVNQGTGQLSGRIQEPGTHRITVTARNARGNATADLRLVVGEAIALTPPMGWNSWYCQSEAVSQASILAMAQAMVRSGLADHGWTYVNIDDGWQGPRLGPDGALTGNAKFPDLGALAGQVHDLGLKLGIYSTPWMGSYAGFRGGSAADPTGADDPRALAPGERLQPDQIFGRYPTFQRLGQNQVGTHWFADADARQWAAWGIDLVKYDWVPNDVPTTRRIAAGLRASGRDIVLSLSNSAPFANAPELMRLAQMWRTTGDIHESWGSVSDIGFRQLEWRGYAGPGHWNDADMLQVGMLGVPNQANTTFHPSPLTPDEQFTQVSLWCLMASPLLLSCDLTQLDDFTLGLLTNDEVLAINQDPLGQPGYQLHPAGPGVVIAKPTEDGAWAVGLFNRDDQPREVTVTLVELGVSGPVQVRDLWRQRDLGQVQGTWSAVIPPHGVRLVGIRTR